MGCASSNPIVQSGKHLIESTKDSVTEAVTKGEHVLHDAGDAAKDGMDHVKEAVEAAVVTAETGFGNIIEKVGHTFSSAKNETEENAAAAATAVAVASEQAEKKIEELPAELALKAKTVLASEIDNGQDFMVRTKTVETKKMTDKLRDEFGEIVSADDKDEAMNETLHIEDLEENTLDALVDNNLKDMKKKAEDLVNGLPGGPPRAESEDAKEE